LPGEQAKFAAIVDELSTLPFLCPRRLVVIEDADKFVSEARPKLEKYVTAPAATGTLVLVVKTWTTSTRLAKLVPAAATVECRAMAAAKLPDWCVRRAKAAHGKAINLPAAQLLVDLVGGDMGLLDQELAKLAAYAADAKEIGRADVDRCVGRSRTEEVWKIFDAIAARQPASGWAFCRVCSSRVRARCRSWVRLAGGCGNGAGPSRSAGGSVDVAGGWPRRVPQYRAAGVGGTTTPPSRRTPARSGVRHARRGRSGHEGL
jgi:hypothetical protein